MRTKIPWLLIYLRLALTLVAIWFGYIHLLGVPYVLLLALAAATDYYDGVLARRYNVETALLRQWDSIADTIFFIGVAIAMVICFPGIILKYAWGIGGIIAIEAIRYVYDYFKFRRGASYHALSAKIFGVCLLAATIQIMGFGVAEPLLPLALVAGILSELEGLVISIVLNEWRYNVKHIGKAIQIKKSIKR